MFNELVTRFTDGSESRLTHPMVSIINTMREAYPEATLIRLNAKHYMLTVDGETTIDDPRLLIGKLLRRDPKVVSFSWTHEEVKHDQ